MKATGPSPTSRSLALLRKAGAIAETTEKWLTFPERKFGKATGKTIRIRQDLFGWCDILAVNPVTGFHFVQTTTTSNQASRLAKIYDSPHATTVLKAGGHIECHGWLKSAKSKRWECTVTPVRIEDCRPIEEIAMKDELFV